MLPTRRTDYILNVMLTFLFVWEYRICNQVKVNEYTLWCPKFTICHSISFCLTQSLAPVAQPLSPLTSKSPRTSTVKPSVSSPPEAQAFWKTSWFRNNQKLLWTVLEHKRRSKQWYYCHSKWHTLYLEKPCFVSGWVAVCIVITGLGMIDSVAGLIGGQVALEII